MTDYNKIIDNIKKNFEHFKFGENGEGWLGGFNFENGKFNDIDWNDVVKKVSEILGYDIKLDEDKKEDKKPVAADKPSTEKKSAFECSAGCVAQVGEDKKASEVARVATTCTYCTELDGDNFKLEVLIPGETVDNFRISVNSKEMKLKINRKSSDDIENLPWYAACKEEIAVDLPEGLKVASLKKKSENGLLVVTGKIAQQKDFETEI